MANKVGPYFTRKNLIFRGIFQDLRVYFHYGIVMKLWNYYEQGNPK